MEFSLLMLNSKQSEGEVIFHKMVSSEHVKLETELVSNCFHNMKD
jgi:hypothetical protein